MSRSEFYRLLSSTIRATLQDPLTREERAGADYCAACDGDPRRKANAERHASHAVPVKPPDPYLDGIMRRLEPQTVPDNSAEAPNWYDT